MIINYLKGGIGNQIFQHALAKSLSLRLNRELFTEISYYQHDPYGFKSKIQNIDPDIKFINIRDIDKTGAYLLKEGQISKLNEIKHLPDSIKILILEGYWQGEEYFDKKIAIDFIENIKKYSTNLENNNEIANKINTSDSPIALHIRRRDYGHMGLCKTSYYSAAIDFLKSLNSNSELFVFSDEPNYTRHLLESRNLSFTLIDTGDDSVDLYLMSRCKNFVISNSPEFDTK